jgi:uncharacterized protein
VRVEGDKTFEAPREEVWRVLIDPESMARTMPGVESFDLHDDRHWTAHVKLRLALTNLSMDVDFERVEERPPEFAKVVARGGGMGASVGMETSFKLEADGPRTHMHWVAEISLGGPLGGLGNRALKPLVDRQVGHLLDSVEERVQAEAEKSRPG